MKRIILSLIALLTLASSAVSAATADELRIIGYSSDGNYFAYETFGVQDGSGFPYASIYVLDVERDKWVKGTPVHSSYGEEETEEEHNITALPAQIQVRLKAAPLLEKLGIKYSHRELATVNVSQKVTDPHKIQFNRYYGASRLWTVQLSELDLESSRDRDCLPESTKGFALSIGIGDKALQEVYRDKRLPKSRPCPVAYKLAKVVVKHGNERLENSMIIMVYMFSRGFEGLAANVLAIPVKLPKFTDY